MIDAGELGNLLLRLAVGGFLLPHGILKLFSFRAEAAELESELGLKPGWLWPSMVVFVQVTSAVMIILGLAVIPNLMLVICLQLGAIFVKNGRNGWFWYRKGIEYNLFWAIAAVAACLHHYARIGFTLL
jgi:putative oxidoreductase